MAAAYRYILFFIIFLFTISSAVAADYSELYNEGMNYLDQGNYQEAVWAFDASLQQNPGFSWAWFNKGVAHYYLGEYQEAVDAYDHAIDLEPNTGIFWTFRSNALYAMDNYGGAELSYNQACVVDPNECRTPPYTSITTRLTTIPTQTSSTLTPYPTTSYPTLTQIVTASVASPNTPNPTDTQLDTSYAPPQVTETIDGFEITPFLIFLVCIIGIILYIG